MLVIADLQRKFLNSLGKNYVPMVAQVISILLHIFWSYVLVVKYDMAIMGTGLASTITTFTNLVIMMVYTLYLEDIQEAVCWPTKSIFIDLGKYLEIGIPCAFILSSGLMTVHAFVFIAGYFGVVSQGAMIIMISFSGITQMISVGLWQAVATIAGAKIGNLEVDTALMYHEVFKKVGQATVVAALIISQIFRKEIIGAFTSHEEILNLTLTIFWIK